MKKLKLKVEMIPKSTHFINLRSLVPDKWDEIRRKCYKDANYKCEICGGKG